MLKSLISKTIGCYINLLGYFRPKEATRLAYKFFTNPRAGRLTDSRLPDVLAEAKQETLTHNGQLFQTYNWPGSGPTILLVHGWESNASRWDLLIDYLKKAHANIIALDAPAHGLSEGLVFTMPQYAEFIDVVVSKHQPEVIIGHSLGGATSLYYQATYQNKNIEKMVILGAPCDMDTLLTNYRGILGLGTNVMNLLHAHFLKYHQLKTVDFTCSLFAKKIKAQGLLAHDLEDDVVSYKEARKIAAAWPEAEFVTTRGLGHSMHSKELYRKIYHFLFEVEFAH